jgi:hypothetical protein
MTRCDNNACVAAPKKAAPVSGVWGTPCGFAIRWTATNLRHQATYMYGSVSLTMNVDKII